MSARLHEVAQHATRTHHIFTEVSMFASAQRMAALTPEQQAAVREAARRAVQAEMWETNIQQQEAAWNDLARRTTAIADPTSRASGSGRSR
jgi:TRAP-type C4-dicarboxylate transport system substrate-binding protein